MAALDFGSLKTYVTGGRRAVPVGTLLIDVTHNLLASRFVEIAFEASSSILSVKEKVYGMTGSSVEHMSVLLNNQIEMHEMDGKSLGEYGAQSGDFIHVIDADPFSTARGGAMDDVSQVKKFELTEEEYDKRDNTYRAYKRKQLALDPNWKSIYQINSEKRVAAAREARRAAGYPDETYEAPDSIRARIQVGQRCQIEPGARRGEVKFVGVVPELLNYEVLNDGTMPSATPEEEAATAAAAAVAAAAAPVAASAAAAAPADPTAGAPQTDVNAEAAVTIPLVGECLWIGVQLDEPVGKHDGIIRGKRYFQANHHAAIFARPNAVKTGDYPWVDPFDEDESDDEAKDDQPPPLQGAGVYEEL